MIRDARPLFSLFGFAVKLDTTSWLLAWLVTWSLAEGMFPALFPERSVQFHWAMALVGTVGLLGSVVLHELSHALVARRYGLTIYGITLFLLGGMAEMREEPPTPRVELLMAGAGPLASLMIAGVCAMLYLPAALSGLEVVAGYLVYLTLVNFTLGLFNLVPAFPLDGGRMLRAVLWAWRGDLLWATRQAARLGGLFAVVLGALGIWVMLAGAVVAGLWWCLLGAFLWAAARMGNRQTEVREALRGEPVQHLMRPRPVNVPEAVAVREWLDELGVSDREHPVTEGERATLRHDLRRLSPNVWGARDPAGPIGEENTVELQTDGLTAFVKMTRNEIGWLLVVEQGRPVGLVILPDLVRFATARLRKRAP